MGNQRILVSIPPISYERMVAFCCSMPEFDYFAQKPIPFKPTGRNLDVFHKELKGVSPKRLWGVNIPHFGLKEHNAWGVAGPGLPNDELYEPPNLEQRIGLGKYDKWRPYPATAPLTYYARQMAYRFCGKRCRIFAYASDNINLCNDRGIQISEPWDVLFYVEHGATSLAHLSQFDANKIAIRVLTTAITVSRSCPSVPIVIFSPYGLGGWEEDNSETDGFLLSNRANPGNDWDFIRSYLNGTVPGGRFDPSRT